MDPFESNYVGTKMGGVSADIATISHAHPDHNHVNVVSGTARRDKPFVISEPGEYEVEGITVFGWQTFHDSVEGKERGENMIYVIQVEDLRILHLGDLGHILPDTLVKKLDGIDVVMVPVGGVYTIGAKEATKVVEALDPYYVIPMHYKTEKHSKEVFGELAGVEEFVKEYGHATRTVKALNVTKLSLPQDSTEVILFET